MKRAILMVCGLFLALYGRTQTGYTLPTVPDSLEDATERVDYASRHFWDRFDFCDTTLLRPDYAEQALTDFLGLLRYASEEGREEAVGHWLALAHEHISSFHYFANQAEAYLYEPESPLCDDRLCAMVLRHLLAYAESEEARSERWRSQLQLLMRNGVGDEAADFCYRTMNGEEHTLGQIVTTCPILLLFYDPDCEHCDEVIASLRQMSHLSEAVRAGRIQVLAVCVARDLEQWRASSDRLPQEWFQAFDCTGIVEHALYDLRQMPALYLLDARHCVLQRNVNMPQLLSYLLSSR